MQSLFAERALLPTGWAASVRVRIDGAGRIRSVEQGVEPLADDLRLRGRVLLPAPSNLHSHAFQRAMAGLAERPVPGEDGFWTWREVMYGFLERLQPEDVEAIAALVQVEMLEAGYAAVGEFHYLHHDPQGVPYADPAAMGAAIAAAASLSGIGLTHLPVFYARGGLDGRACEGGQRRFASDFEGFARLLEASERALAGLPADTRLGLAPHSLRAVGADDLAAVTSLLPAAPLHLHIAEQVREVEEVEAAYGLRPVAWLLERMPVDRRWCLVHATHMTPAETRALAATGAVAGLCPLTEANLGDGLFDGARFVAAGGRFGVGSDSHIRIALAEELRCLEGGQRLRDRARNVLARSPASTGRTLFEAALEGGAQALGRDAGAIAPGLWADLVSLDSETPTLAGLDGDTLLDAWLLAGDDALVADVWAAGRHMVSGGRHVRAEQVRRRFVEVVGRLRAAL